MIITSWEDVAEDDDDGDDAGAPIQDLEFGTFLKKAPQRQIWDFGTKLGLFWDHFYTLLGLLVVIFIKMPQNLQKAKKALKTVLSRRLMQRVF